MQLKPPTEIDPRTELLEAAKKTCPEQIEAVETDIGQLIQSFQARIERVSKGAVPNVQGLAKAEIQDWQTEKARQNVYTEYKKLMAGQGFENISYKEFISNPEGKGLHGLSTPFARFEKLRKQKITIGSKLCRKGRKAQARVIEITPDVIVMVEDKDGKIAPYRDLAGYENIAIEKERELAERGRYYFKDFGALLQGILSDLEIFIHGDANIERADSIRNAVWKLRDAIDSIPLEKATGHPDYKLFVVVKLTIGKLAREMENIINGKKDINQAHEMIKTIHQKGMEYRKKLMALQDELRTHPGFEKAGLKSVSVADGKIHESSL